jgi:DNA-binding MarR family transcriptional regulator
MDRLEDCISFLIGKAAQQITRRARDALAPHGVTPVQYAFLKVLWEQDGQSGAELGSRLVFDSATMTGIIDRLEAAGLVERRSDPGGDRRVNRVFLTRRARDLQKPLDAAADALNAEVVRELGSKRARELWRALGELGQLRAADGSRRAS